MLKLQAVRPHVSRDVLIHHDGYGSCPTGLYAGARKLRRAPIDAPLLNPLRGASDLVTTVGSKGLGRSNASRRAAANSKDAGTMAGERNPSMDSTTGDRCGNERDPDRCGAMGRLSRLATRQRRQSPNASMNLR